jgi:hypothetical protein
MYFMSVMDAGCGAIRYTFGNRSFKSQVLLLNITSHY